MATGSTHPSRARTPASVSGGLCQASATLTQAPIELAHHLSPPHCTGAPSAAGTYVCIAWPTWPWLATPAPGRRSSGTPGRAGTSWQAAAWRWRPRPVKPAAPGVARRWLLWAGARCQLHMCNRLVGGLSWQLGSLCGGPMRPARGGAASPLCMAPRCPVRSVAHLDLLQEPLPLLELDDIPQRDAHRLPILVRYPAACRRGRWHSCVGLER